MSQDIEHCGGVDSTADLACFLLDLKEACSCDKVFPTSSYLDFPKLYERYVNQFHFAFTRSHTRTPLQVLCCM